MAPGRHPPIPAPPDIPLRIPDWPLPPGRFVPGCAPHPRKGGWGVVIDPTGRPPVDADGLTARAWGRGLDLLARRYYWACHEHLEEAWHLLPRDHGDRDVCQGVIQIAASALKVHMGHTAAARRLAERAGRRLDRPPYRGTDLRALAAMAREHAAGRGPPPLPQGGPKKA